MLTVEGFIISALFPLAAVGAWSGAVAAAWKQRRGLMIVLIGAAVLASAATFYLLLWFYTN
jgi:uncharacterized membrane protein